MPLGVPAVSGKAVIRSVGSGQGRSGSAQGRSGKRGLTEGGKWGKEWRPRNALFPAPSLKPRAPPRRLTPGVFRARPGSFFFPGA
jgi:hypothetical protein